uniref:Major facilitator superfamily multidrug transporter NAG4 (N-acetylglucosamine utilization protein 4) (Transmembrane protein 2) n=1 Tax=Ganoderma boninense TaxID=34458 RepID=A0A5K1K771_9APHY|nr:Major facilitator superfamily multidrug transporter NAG4 (N-acetylglucosamine utilization protein 4) (Transmembrane protein 2) [Ganoderma boninense]
MTLNLRTLDLGDLTMDDAMLQAIHRLLQVPALDALESLTLGPWPMYPTLVLPEDSELIKMSPVSLPSLTDLQIFTTSAAVDQYLCAHWEVPHLARFTILACTGWPEQLLGRFGRRLRYLHLFPTPQVFSNSQVFMPTLEGCSTLADVCPALEHLVLPKLATPPSLLINSPTLVHLDFWRARGQPVRWKRLDQSIATAALRHATRPGNTLPSLRTVRMLYTWGPHDVLSQHGFGRFPFPYYTSTAGTGTGAGARSTRSVGGTTTRSHVRNPDWPWICHPRLLAEGSDDVLYYRFPQGWVAQTVAALIPQDLGEYRWDLQESLLSEEDWPAVYVHFEELLRAFQKWGESDSGDVAEEVVEEGEGQEGLDDVLRVDGTKGDGIGDGRGNGNGNGNGDGDGDGDGQAKAEGAGDAPISEDVEGRESEELERLAREEEERREEERQECAEAATELTLPEYPVMQLDRETVLAAFRSSRDRESYNHTDIWDNH